MNSKSCIFAFYIHVFLCFGNVCLGQGARSIPEQADRLMEIAKSQSFDELIDSISRHDQETYGALSLLGRNGARLESSQLRQAIRDPRVRKLFELATKMTKEQAATKIEDAFRNKLKEHKKAGGMYSQHGLHSTLFLASEFCSRDTFNELLVEWVDWSRGQLLSGEYKKDYEGLPSKLRNDHMKLLFVRNRSPELLMLSSLVVNNQIRQGKTEEEAIGLLKDAFGQAGWTYDLPAVSFRDLLPLDASNADNPLTRIAMFNTNWTSDIDMQIRLIDEARNCLAPPGVIGGAIKVVEKAALEGKWMVEKREDADWYRFKNGTRLTLAWRDRGRRDFRKWGPSESPKKAEAISELDRMIAENIPEAMREDWEGPVVEAKKWINEVPETGTDKSVPISKRWPEVKAESDAERPEEPEYWIELEVVDASSLSGPPKKASEKDGDGKSDK